VKALAAHWFRKYPNFLMSNDILVQQLTHNKNNNIRCLAFNVFCLDYNLITVIITLTPDQQRQLHKQF
jgi:hypothetical protein